MATIAENKLLTQVGSGTPMGELLRRYWWPITGSGQLVKNPIVGLRILGEDLTLFRDKSGNLGLVEQRCAHRRVDLKLGLTDKEGIRCMYHGWLYNERGECIDMPLEPEGRAAQDNVKIKAYPVQELGGLIFAYMGPDPVPLLPRWDLLMWDNAFRHVGAVVLEANWLQCMENSVDTAHTEYVHGHWFKYTQFDVGGGTGDEKHDATLLRIANAFTKKHLKMDWKMFDHGIMKYRLREGEDENEAPDWLIGHPLVFPYMVRLGGTIRNEFQIRVPVDDSHTLHLEYFAYAPGPDVKVPDQDYIPYFEHPIFDEAGNPIVDYVVAQDMAAWWGQGAIVDRENEWLATSDAGVLMLRRLLKEQIKIVQDGGEPMNVFRDPATNERIDLPTNVGPGPVARAGDAERDLTSVSFVDALFMKYHQVDRYSPVIDQILDIYKRFDEVRQGVKS
ncbi:MAG: Rieske 2Fe-2S domain-containing protein [Dehalococcoidia bacterium]